MKYEDEPKDYSKIYAYIDRRISEVRKDKSVKSPIIRAVGYTLIGVGVITCFVPFTTVPLLITGFSMIGLSWFMVKYKFRNGIYKRVLKDKLLLLKSIKWRLRK